VEFADRVARLHPGIPILLTTEYDPLPLDIEMHDVEILRKPYDLDTLKRAIDSCLARRAGDTAP
jgi:two-component SAPR family response regulator